MAMESKPLLDINPIIGQYSYVFRQIEEGK